MPIIYEATAVTDIVRVLRIDAKFVTEFFHKKDIEFLQEKMWQKLKFIMDRVTQTHNAKQKVQDSSTSTNSLALGVKHIESIVPNSTY